MTDSAEPPAVEPPVDLKDPALAAFLAWLFPGLGHLYQRRVGKAGLFFVCIMGTFVYGLYLGSSNELQPWPCQAEAKIGWGRVVYFSWRERDGEKDKRAAYFWQVAVGLPALPAVFQAIRMNNGKEVWGGFMAPPRLSSTHHDDPNYGQPTAHALHKVLGRNFELGTVYTMIAGLLNILAIYDAWGGPVVTETAKKEEEDEEEDKGEDDREDEGVDEREGEDIKAR